MKIYRLAQNSEDLFEEALKYDSSEDFADAYSVKQNLINYGIPINSDGSVTLYHTTDKETAEKIEEEGVFIGGSTATGGMTGLALEPSAFFGWNKGWVNSRWGRGVLIEINVPYQYIRQPAKNPHEIYFEGGLKRVDKSSNIWEPIMKPRETFYNRLPALDYDTRNEQNTLKNIWEHAHQASKDEF